MATWKPLSGPFVSPNGLVVKALASDGELAQLGSDLRNGLQVGQARDHWAALCAEGRRQILSVSPAGADDSTAGVEVEVKRGEARAMFVRGMYNQEYGPGTPEFEAVASYLAAVNGHAIPLTMDVGQNGFAEPEAPAAQAASPWERAIAFARRFAISPFKALVMGDDAMKEAQENGAAPAVEEEHVSWRALTERFAAANGLVVEPIGDSAGLKKLGEEMENNLFQAYAAYVAPCERGVTQFAAIYHEQDGIVGYAEFRAVAGQVVPVACRSRFDYDPSPEMTSAVREYVRALNGGTLQTEVGVGGNAFVMDGPAEEFDPLANGGGHFDASSTLGRASRGGFDGAFGLDPDGDDAAYFGPGDEEEDDLEGLSSDEGGTFGPRAAAPDDRRFTGAPIGPHEWAQDFIVDVDGFRHGRAFPVQAVEGVPTEWTALSGAFNASYGYLVEPISSEEEAFWIGVAFDNALATERTRQGYVNQCSRGEAQIVRIIDASGPTPKLMGAAFVGAEDGEAVVRHAVGLRNRNLVGHPRQALDEYVIAVNGRRIELAGEPGDHGFDFQAPRHGMN